MKNFFYNILFVSVLCCGFSVYAQEQESAWVTCDSSDECVEFSRHNIQKILYDAEYAYVYYQKAVIPRYFTCLRSDFSIGKNCANSFNRQ